MDNNDILQLSTADASGPDTFGETSSESYSSPSSPQHRRGESLDSEDDNNKGKIGSQLRIVTVVKMKVTHINTPKSY